MIKIFLVSPNGFLQVYNPITNKTKIVTKDMPRDLNDPEAQKNRVKQVENAEKRSAPFLDKDKNVQNK